MSLTNQFLYTMNEENVKTFYILPALQKSGWNNPEVLHAEYKITDGRVVATSGAKPFREKPKYADYALFYKGQPIAIVEAKKSDVPQSTGIQQALVYADMLDVPFAYCCNGSSFYEHDRLTHTEKEIPIDQFPTSEQLVERMHDFYNYTPEQLNVIEQPYYWDEGFNEPRYYQRRAINETVKRIAKGENRLLLVMATGTGKTYTAFQIIYRLKQAGLKKRILYLADRNILIDQTIKQDFRPFAKYMTKITNHFMSSSAEVYLALYHQFYDSRINNDNEQPYTQYAKDFFDFIIIDECHRGSRKADSEWHKILEYFSTATQLGLTATPRQDKNVEDDNIAYFGEPVFTYSLKDGIADGFLAPYMTTKINISVDETGYKPEKDETDLNNVAFESEEPFQRPQFGKQIEIKDRDILVAKYITAKLHQIGRMTKTIVFCNSDDEADKIRHYLINLNSDMVAIDNRYVTRITGTDQYGKKQLDNFINVNEAFPVIATTVDLLSTGVDCKTCGLIAINQSISSMARFKQIVGRGTRLREDKGKMAFYILDFANATEKFFDPEFDEPTTYEPPTDLGGEGSSGSTSGGNGGCGSGNDGSGNGGSGNGGNTGGGSGSGGNTGGAPKPIKYVVKGRNVQVNGEQVYYLGEDGKPVTEQYTVYARRNILGTYATLDDFISKWNAAERKTAVADILENNGVMIDIVRELCPEIADADIFDIVCYVAYGQKNPPSRAQRAEKVRRRKFFDKFSGVARQVVETLLDKYAQNGIVEFEKRTILNQDPFTKIGSPKKIIKEIGSIDQYELLITQIEEELYKIA